MKYFLLSLLILMLLHGEIFSQKQIDIIEIEQQKYSQLIQMEAMAAANDNGSNIDEKYVRFNLTMDPGISPATISGSVTHYFTTTKANVDTIKYDLYNVGMNVVSLVYHGTTYSSAARISHIVDTVRIILPAPISVIGTLDSVTINYNGTPPNSVNSRGYKRSTALGSANLSTHSSGYFARQWWPCKHVLGDKIDSIDVIVTSPSVNLVVSNGLLQVANPPIVGGNKTWWWKSRYPVAHYLIAIAAYPYVIHNSPAAIIGGTSVPITNYITAATNTVTNQNALNAMKPVMEHFSTLFGEYPFKNEKYGHVAYTFGGGMENQTVSFIGTGALSNRSLLAHELAHQWWGDQVTCDSWANIWVNEGFARYSEILYSEQFETAAAAQTKRASHKSSAKVASGIVYRYDTEVVTEADHTGKIFVGSMVYDKASIIISMLRKLVGNADFIVAMKNYLADPLITYGNASTEDVKRHFEAVSGQDLTSFFDDFIYRQGWPIYTVNWGTTASAPYFIGINYTQGKSAGSTVAYYNTVLPIRLRNTGLGKDTMIYIFDQPALAGTDQYFQTSFPVTSIEVDPYSEAYTYDWIINAPTTILPLQLTSFTGTKKGKDAHLEWQAEAMKDFSHFELLKSADGIQFESIAKIPGLETKNEYSFTDNKVLPGNNYYKLKMVDLDGRENFSNTILLQFSEIAKVKVWPNPASNKIIVENQSGVNFDHASIRMINSAGKSFTPNGISLGSQVTEINVSGVPNGVYWLEIRNRNGTKLVERIIIRH